MWLWEYVNRIIVTYSYCHSRKMSTIIDIYMYHICIIICNIINGIHSSYYMPTNNFFLRWWWFYYWPRTLYLLYFWHLEFGSDIRASHCYWISSHVTSLDSTGLYISSPQLMAAQIPIKDSNLHVIYQIVFRLCAHLWWNMRVHPDTTQYIISIFNYRWMFRAQHWRVDHRTFHDRYNWL